MDEGLGPIDIEFIINNPQLTQDAAKAEETLTGVADEMQAQAKAASDAIKLISANTVESLKLQAAQYQALADLTPVSNTSKIAQYNQQIEQIQQQITQLGNVGKAGFDELGNALPIEQTSKFSAAISRVTDISNVK